MTYDCCKLVLFPQEEFSFRESLSGKINNKGFSIFQTSTMTILRFVVHVIKIQAAIDPFCYLKNTAQQKSTIVHKVKN